MEQIAVHILQSKPVRTDSENSIRERWGSYSGTPWEAASAALDVLMTIASVVRSVVPKTASLLSTHYPRPDDSYFSVLSASLVKYKYVNVRQSLADQLGFSISIRRKRLLYQQQHESKVVYPANQDKDASFGSVLPANKPQNRAELSTAPPVAKGPRKVELLASTAPSVFNPQRLREPLYPRTTLSGETTGSPTNDELRYPPQPSFGPTQIWCTCPYCYRPLKISDFQRDVAFWR